MVEKHLSGRIVHLSEEAGSTREYHLPLMISACQDGQDGQDGVTT